MNLSDTNYYKVIIVQLNAMYCAPTFFEGDCTSCTAVVKVLEIIIINIAITHSTQI